MRAAILDFGTNTFNLLIAEKSGEGFRVLYSGKEAVKLGRGGIHKGIITPEAMERGLAAIGKHMETIGRFGNPGIHAFATSAMRNAVNGNLFAAMIREKYGFETRIIPGTEEAELIHEGIMASVDMDNETALIMDIGGGSNELIICNREEILWRHSFELGMARIIEQFTISDPITSKETGAIEAHYQEALQPLFPEADKYRPTLLIGASGTFDTLAAMALHRFGSAPDPGASSMIIPTEQYLEMHSLLLRSTAAERLAMPGMEPVRVEMIVPATIFINFVFSRCRLTSIRQSEYALKEGVMARLVRL